MQMLFLLINGLFPAEGALACLAILAFYLYWLKSGGEGGYHPHQREHGSDPEANLPNFTIYTAINFCFLVAFSYPCISVHRLAKLSGDGLLKILVVVQIQALSKLS